MADDNNIPFFGIENEPNPEAFNIKTENDDGFEFCSWAPLLLDTYRINGEGTTKADPPPDTSLQNVVAPFNNCIIVGSKPNLTKETIHYTGPTFSEVNVTLKDCQSILLNNDRFCNDCGTLFSTVEAINKHKIKYHNTDDSFKNISKNNVESASIETNCIEEIECIVCNEIFGSEDDLIKHMYLHISTLQQCNVCEDTFLNEQLLNEHKKSHQIDDGVERNYDLSDVSSINSNISDANSDLGDGEDNLSESDDESCEYRRQTRILFSKRKHKASNGSANDNRSDSSESEIDAPVIAKAKSSYILNNNKGKKIYIDPTNIPNFMRKLILSKGNLGRTSFAYICELCGCAFHLWSRFLRHLLNYHNEKLKPTIYRVGIPEFRCKSCLTVFKNARYFNKHMHRTHKDFRHNVKVINNTINSVPNDNASNTTDTMADIIIPKCTLFKCVKCDIHFTDIATANVHNKGCKGPGLNNRICDKCNIKLYDLDIACHEIQHTFGDNFNVLNVDLQNLQTKLLCLCPKCGVHFSINVFSSHVNSCSSAPSNNYYCLDCNILIDLQMRSNHNDSHKSLRLKPKHFITITFTTVKEDKLTKKRKIIENEMSRKRMKVLNDCRTVIYYCELCMSYFVHISARIIKAHLSGSCAKYVKYICCDCGLSFAKKSWNTHKQLHIKKGNLSLNDFIFRDINAEPIRPPVPVSLYPTCKMCQVKFHSKKELQTHNCFKIDCQACSICNETFVKTTYDLHMNFHNYEVNHKDEEVEVGKEVKNAHQIIPEADSKETVIHKNFRVYFCDICKCFTNSTKHSGSTCQTAHTNSITCDDCGLIFTVYTIETHRRIHRRVQSLQLQDFFFYNLDTLKQIKPPIPNYYNCKVCTITFHNRISVWSHKCGYRKFKFCDTCDIKLSFKAYELHLAFHSYKMIVDGVDIEKTVKPIEVTPKFIEAPAEDNNEKAETLSDDEYSVIYKCQNCCGVFTKSQAKVHASLQFDCKNLRHLLYPCHECNQILYEDFTKSHAKCHKRHAKTKKFGNEFVPEVSKFVLDDSDDGDGKMYRFFQCSYCKLSLNYSNEIDRHVCVSKATRKVCSKCGLILEENMLEDHLSHHDKDPFFVKKNFKIQKFPEETLPQENAAGKYNFYECRKCKLCITSKLQIKNHACDQGILKKCEQCALTISKKSYNIHCEEHKRNPNFNKDKFKIVPFISAKNNTNTSTKQHLLLYRCSRCSGCVKTRKSMIYHIKNNSCGEAHSKSVHQCDICFLWFVNQKDHQKLHERLPGLTRKQMTVVNFNKKGELERPVQKTRTFNFYQCSECKIVLSNKHSCDLHRCKGRLFTNVTICKLCHLPISNRSEYKKQHHYKHLQYPDMLPENIRLLEFRSKSHELNSVDNHGILDLDHNSNNGRLNVKKCTIYHCQKCQLCFVSKNGAKVHFLSENCIDGKRSTCTECGYDFKFKSIHKKHHEEFPDITRENINVVPITPFTMQTQLERNNCNLKGKILYQCQKCNVCFGELVGHRCSDVKEKHKCNVCNNYFELSYMEKHAELHRDNQNDVNDINVVPINSIDEDLNREPNSTIYRCPKCDVHFYSEITIRHHIRVAKHVILRPVLPCPVCNLKFVSLSLSKHFQIHHVEQTLSVEDFQIKDMFCGSRLRANIEHVRNNVREIEESGRFKKRESQIYKCVCGLHFLCQTSSQEHAEECCGISIEFTNTGLKCGLCDLYFDKKQLIRHSLQHHSSKNETTYEILKVSPQINWKLYKCCVCNTHFPTENSVKSHLNQCDSSNIGSTLCTICNFAIHSSVIEMHTNSHDNGAIDFEVVLFKAGKTSIVEAEKEKNNNRSNNNVLYHCKKCDIYYAKEDSAHYHLYKSKHKVGKIVAPCPVCGLKFTEAALHNHYKYHHDKFNYKLEDFVIEDIESIQRFASDPANMTEEDAQKYRNVIYKCKTCLAHFVKKDAFEFHLTKKNKGVHYPPPSQLCKMCNILFVQAHMDLHTNLHHRINNYNIEDYDIVESDISTYKANEVTEIEDTPHTRTPLSKENQETSQDIDQLMKRKVVPVDNNLYYCEQCNVHFLKEVTISRHLKPKHMEVKNSLPCKICGLVFSARSLIIHVAEHHEKLKYSLNDFNIIRSPALYGVGKQKVDNHNTEDTNTTNLENIAEKPKVDLYFCERCDVHFIKENTFIKHLGRHLKRRLTGILNCDFCDLKFTYRAMPEHRSLHHGKWKYDVEEFNIIRHVFKDSCEDSVIGNTDENKEQNYLNFIKIDTDTSDVIPDEDSNGNIDENRQQQNDLNCMKIDTDTSDVIPDEDSNGNTDENRQQQNDLNCMKIDTDTSDVIPEENSNGNTDENREQQNNLNCMKVGTETCDIILTAVSNVLNTTKSVIAEQSNDEIHSLNTSCDPTFGEHSNLKSKPKKRRISKPEPQGIYYCKLCACHFLNPSTYSIHINLHEKQGGIKETTPCKVCGLVFTSLALPKHMEINHIDAKIRFEEGTTPDSEFDHRNLYYCDMCDIHFSKQSTFTKHAIFPHDIVKAISECELCHLNFTSRSLEPHKMLHHEKLKYQLADFRIINCHFSDLHRDLQANCLDNVSQVNSPEMIEKNLYYCTLCDIYFLKHLTLIIHSTGTHRAIKIKTKCDECGLNFSQSSLVRHKFMHHKQMHLKASDFLIIDSKLRRIYIDSNEFENIDNAEKEIDAIRYYKCLDCNVTFLEKNDCENHIVNHKRVSNLDFLECKVCTLNFKLESLPTHMQQHKVKEFSLQDIDIITYDPTSRSTK